MALATLIAITLACIGWSLWIRRVTWSSRWEFAATLNIALQGGAVLLMSPWASETLGVALHALTGKWNLEDYIGHDLYIVAASAVVYNALGRLQDDHSLQKSFKQYVEYPATLCIPLLLVTFSLGNGAKIYKADFFQVPTDFWLNIYWLLLCGILIYLLGYGGRALLVLRQGSAFTSGRQYLPRGLCGGRGRMPRPPRHRLHPAAADDLGRYHAGVGVRLHVRRRIRDHIGGVLAKQDQVVLERRPLS